MKMCREREREGENGGGGGGGLLVVGVGGRKLDKLKFLSLHTFRTMKREINEN